MANVAFLDLVVGTFRGEGDVSLEVWENRSVVASAPSPGTALRE